jgi:hypothetical protein
LDHLGKSILDPTFNNHRFLLLLADPLLLPADPLLLPPDPPTQHEQEIVELQILNVGLIEAAPQPKKMDFPDVKFWLRYDWTLRKEAPKTFVETEQGDPVDEEQWDEMCKYVHTIWDTFIADGSAPSSWGQAVRKQYHRQGISRATTSFFLLPSIPQTLWVLMHIVKINGLIKCSCKSQLYKVNLWSRL